FTHVSADMMCQISRRIYIYPLKVISGADDDMRQLPIAVRGDRKSEESAMTSRKRRGKWARSVMAVIAGLGVVRAVAVASPAHADDGGVSDAPILGIWEVQSLNGVNNNPFVPNVGAANTRYLRIAPANYADGRSQMVSGPDPRFVSNRVFNDTNANVF